MMEDAYFKAGRDLSEISKLFNTPFPSLNNHHDNNNPIYSRACSCIQCFILCVYLFVIYFDFDMLDYDQISNKCWAVMCSAY